MKVDFTKRDSNIVKGIAIIMMIFHHLFRLKEFSSGYSVSFFPFTIGRVAQLCTFFKICVPMFFFISGYGLSKVYKRYIKEKHKNNNEFFIKRYLKIMPTFWFVMIVSLIYGQIMSNMVSKIFFSRSTSDGIVNILFNFSGLSGILRTTNFDNNWWYIGASLIFIFFVPMIYSFVKKSSWLTVGIGIIILPRIIGISNFSTTTALPFIFTLYLGMLCEEKNVIEKVTSFEILNNKILNKIVRFILYIIFLLILYIYSKDISRDVMWEIHFGLTPLIVILFIKEFISIIPFISDILESLGKHSYIMYLFHGIIITQHRSFLLNNRNFIISGLILLIISYIISIVLEKIMTIIGYNKIFNKIIKD